MYLNSQLKSIRLHLLLSKRRSLLVQMSQKQVQRRVERNFPRRKLGLFLLLQSLWSLWWHPSFTSSLQHVSKWLQINLLRQWTPRIIAKQQICFQPITINGQRMKPKALSPAWKIKGSISVQSWTRSSIMVEKAAIRINLETRFLVWKRRTRNLESSKNTVWPAIQCKWRSRPIWTKPNSKWLPIKPWPWRKMQWQTLVLSITIQKKWNWLLKLKSEMLLLRSISILKKQQRIT